MIDTKLLRQKILDLAIRGKLVPQTPADEPASELLKKIKAEKEELVKAGKIKKDKHESFIFKGDDNRYYETIDGKTADITDEIPFELPTNWAWCRLRNFCITIVDCPHSTPHYQTTPTSCWAIDTNCIDKNGYIIRKRFLGDNEFIARTKQCVPRGNDIIMSREGTIGLVAILPTGERICLGQRVMLLRPSSNCIPLYMRNTLATEKFLSQFLSKSRGMGVQHINVEDIRNGFFPLPPLAEQQRIVEQIKKLLGYVVDIIDTDAETLEKSITLAKQKILDLAIRGKLVPQDPTDEPASELLKKIKAEKEALVKDGKIKKDKHESFIFKGDDNCYYEQFGNEQRIIDNISFEIPDNWAWCRLEDIALLLMGQSPAGNSVSEEECGIEFHQGKIYFSDRFLLQSPQRTAEPTRIAPANSVLICVRAPVGTVNITLRYICIGRGLASATPLAGISTDFLFYLLNARKSALVEQATGSTFTSVTREQIKELLIPLPPLPEQEKIVSYIKQYETILKSIQE